MGRFSVEFTESEGKIKGVFKSFSNKDIAAEFPSYINFKLFLEPKSSMVRIKSLTIPNSMLKPKLSKNDITRIRQCVKETMKDFIDFASVNFFKISLDRFFTDNLVAFYKNIYKDNGGLVETITNIYNEEVVKKYFNKIGETFIGDYDAIKSESIYSWSSRYVTPVTQICNSYNSIQAITSYLKNSKAFTYDNLHITEVKGVSIISSSPRYFLKVYSYAVRDQGERSRLFNGRFHTLKEYKFKDGYPSLQLEKAFKLYEAVNKDYQLKKKLVYSEDFSSVTVGLTIRPEAGTAELEVSDVKIDQIVKVNLLDKYSVEELLKVVKACNTFFVRII